MTQKIWLIRIIEAIENLDSWKEKANNARERIFNVIRGNI